MDHECEWSGPLDEAVHPKADPEDFRCPQCGRRTLAIHEAASTVSEVPK